MHMGQSPLLGHMLHRPITSLTKHKFKNKITKNFKTVTARH